MKIDGIYNVRDLGGYVTESGERTLQGLFFRGGALSDDTSHAYNHNLTANGAAYMRDVLGIKTDFDLRTQEENLGLTSSPIPGRRSNIITWAVIQMLSGHTKTLIKECLPRLRTRAGIPSICIARAARTERVRYRFS